LNEDAVPKTLYGHSDPIHIMKLSPFNNIIISADTFGKIKVCEFPNIFNIISVILYKNEDIKYIEFLSNREIVLLDSLNVLHIWSLDDFTLQSKTNLNINPGQEIISIIPFVEKYIFLELNEYYYLYEKKDNELIKVSEIKKENTVTDNEAIKTKTFVKYEPNKKILQIILMDSSCNIQNTIVKILN